MSVSVPCHGATLILCEPSMIIVDSQKGKGGAKDETFAYDVSARPLKRTAPKSEAPETGPPPVAPR